MKATFGGRIKNSWRSMDASQPARFRVGCFCFATCSFDEGLMNFTDRFGHIVVVLLRRLTCSRAVRMFGRLSRLGWCSTCLVLGLLAGSSRAEDQYFDFLRGLQDEGYGELSMLYLEQIKTHPSLPEELKTTFDLEMATSLRVAAEETPNADLKQKYLVDAQVLLDKFLKEFARHASAACRQLTRVRPPPRQRHEVVPRRRETPRRRVVPPRMERDSHLMRPSARDQAEIGARSSVR